MRTRIIISIVFLSLGLIIAAIPNNKTLNFKMSAEEMIEEFNGRYQFISPDEIADMMISEDPNLQLIDLRSESEYREFHLPGAVNIPFTDLLDDEYRYLVDQDLKINVFYSNGSVTSNEAWMVTRQLGYRNNYVLEGGLNYWAETIMNPDRPEQTSPNEEIARYNFRKGAGAALGGGSIEPATEMPEPVLPAIKKRPQKKRAQGGC
ncbi:MAG TPA: rhodanese-like domain-containing protein [Bacteroidales bacterium]|nr:rhodanese-like domain-containing protein [Bacteroidales bacterium]